MSLGDVSWLMRHEMYGPFEQLPIVCGRRKKWKPLLVGDGVLGVPTSRGRIALIDSEDLALVYLYTWIEYPAKRKTYNHTSYAYAFLAGNRIYMHKVVLGAADGVLVDHISGDGFDNRKINLRIASASMNGANIRRIRGKSRFKGVFRTSNGKKWRSAVRYKNHRFHLGVFVSEVEAARAYDKKAKELFGEFAYTNADAGLL